MQIQQPSTDGFIVRRRRAGGTPSRPRATLNSLDKGVPEKYLVNPEKNNSAQSNLPQLERRETAGVTGNGSLALPTPRQKIDLDMNLDDSGEPGKKSKVRKKWPRKRIVKWALIGLAIVILAVGAFFAYKILITGGKIFKGNLVGAFFSEGKELKVDENGRANILLFGTSEDDPGHDGADLTDSVMIVSVHPKKKNAFMVSVPRDLYVDYGRACASGYRGKMNVIYSCHKKEGEDAAQEAMRKKLGEVFGLDIQYSVHLNYTALRQAVDAVGGITVNIESRDPRGIMDRNFDWDCPKGSGTCYNVKYPNGPAQMDGKHALYLARARGADPLGRTYGLGQANFDREQYQRKILVALKDKAVSAGTLANPVAVNNLLDALGNNVRTNFDAEEIKTLVKLGQEIKSESISSLQLNDPEDPLVTTGNADGQSIVRPEKGLYEYSDIQAAVKAYATGDPSIIAEKAIVDVLNASEQAGAAQTQADKVTGAGIKIGIIGNAPASLNTAPIQLYDTTNGQKPGTLKKLEELFGVKAKTGKPAGVNATGNFVIIVGASSE
ncbi:MAG: LCP family protein [Candidatus Saccharimonadales bacterium]